MATSLPRVPGDLALAPLRPLSAAHYMTLDNMLDFSHGLSIDRMQVEFIASRVSALNECFY